MKQLHLLPLVPEETIEQRVGSFRSHEDEVRCCLPDVLLATMSILYTLYKQTRLLEYMLCLRALHNNRNQVFMAQAISTRAQ